jgi:aspartyl-tRNA(Asn)/glutamyl-tRNA(Gln) amidotransferase subunit A
MTVQEYEAARRELAGLRVEFERAYAGVDALVTPTTQYVARCVHELGGTPPPNAFTRFVNLVGACAIALPCGFSAEGLPCSLQIIGRAGAELGLLRIAAAYERATPWRHARPPEPAPALAGNGLRRRECDALDACGAGAAGARHR